MPISKAHVSIRSRLSHGLYKQSLFQILHTVQIGVRCCFREEKGRTRRGTPHTASEMSMLPRRTRSRHTIEQQENLLPRKKSRLPALKPRYVRLAQAGRSNAWLTQEDGVPLFALIPNNGRHVRLCGVLSREDVKQSDCLLKRPHTLTTLSKLA